MRSSPVTVLLVALAAGLGLAVLITVIATQQSWLGLKLAADTENDRVIIRSVFPDSPAADLVPGTVIERVTGSNGLFVELSATDLIEEADAVDSFAAYDEFMRRQDTLSEITASESVTLTFADGQSAIIDPAPVRPIGSLPINFWIQILVAFTALMIGAAVRALKPGNAGSTMLLICGVAYVCAAYPSIIYMTRELALPSGLFRSLNIVNSTGSSVFTITMLVMFLTYPRRLVNNWVVAGLVAVSLTWLFLDYLQILLPGPHVGRYAVVAVTLLGALAVAVVQYIQARDDPRMRAALAWFGLSLALATGAHIIMFTVPVMLGQTPDYTQTFAYALGLILYAGLALSIIRYRLFDIDRLGFFLLFYAAGALLLLVLDGALILLFSTDPRTAFGISLLAIALTYLPARDLIWRRITKRRRVDDQEMFASIMDLAFEPSPARRQTQWTELLKSLFDPLQIEPRQVLAEDPVIGDEGLEMIVPATAELPAMAMRYPRRGRGLFSSRHRQIAQSLVAFVERAETGRKAYALGAADERMRISRDMHDNIGAQLLSALHSPAVERKNQMIGQSLSDLRDIIRNSTRSDMPVEEMLADLRAETAERLAPTSIRLDWRASLDEHITLLTDTSYALRSILREAVSNIMRHSNASSVAVSIGASDGHLTLEIVDDGQGFDASARHPGNGLDSMQSRADSLGGSLTILSNSGGTRLTAKLPADMPSMAL